jgi:hypothetical protein
MGWDEGEMYEMYDLLFFDAVKWWMGFSLISCMNVFISTPGALDMHETHMSPVVSVKLGREEESYSLNAS